VPFQELNNSIWSKLPDCEVDEEELKRLFTIKTGPKKTASVKDVAQTANKRVMLLDLKRNNQISIALAKFRKPNEEIVTALKKLDEKFIKLEDIPRLRDLTPTAEEREMLAPYLQGAEPTSKLDNAERFLLEMMQAAPSSA
jgi:hypothetical protein